MKDKIIEFIHRRFKVDCNWLEGNCYYFAIILKSRFPELEIEYDYVNGHFIVSDSEGNFYDFRGEIKPESHLKYETIKDTDTAWFERPKRDCID